MAKNFSDKKLAVVLFNLGGPDCRDSVRPFLYNLFSDKQIVTIPSPFRQLLAFLIAWRRYRFSQGAYDYIGGGSPLLANTQAQAQALKDVLLKDFADVVIFTAMRYWHPRAEAVLELVRAYDPDHLVLLPLYPHYSTTTTESSLQEWKALAKKLKRSHFKTHPICCYWNDKRFLSAHAAILQKAMKSHFKGGHKKGKHHILFSAHGVPTRIIARGDPYQEHVEASAQALAQLVGLKRSEWSLSYQSRVGPLEWLGPETGSEIERLTKVKKKKCIFLIPLSFVSEHMETLVALDIELKAHADAVRLEHYIRVSTLSCHPMFISCLSGLVRRSLDESRLVCADEDNVCTSVFD